MVKVSIPDQKNPLIYLGQVASLTYGNGKKINYKSHNRPHFSVTNDEVTYYLFSSEMVRTNYNLASFPKKEIYERFTGFSSDAVVKVEVSLPSDKNPLIELGTLMTITYTGTPKTDDSQRETLWVHETNEPRPTVYKTQDEKTMLIQGGKMRIKILGDGVAWLVD